MSNLMPISQQRILSLAFASQRLGFVVSYGAKNLIDWGVKSNSKNNSTKLLEDVGILLERFRPDALLIQNVNDSDCRLGKTQCHNVKEVQRLVKTLPNNIKIVREVCKADICTSLRLPKGTDKYTIAEKVGTDFQLALNFVPEPRKLWESENRKMPMFVALSFIATL